MFVKYYIPILFFLSLFVFGCTYPDDTEGTTPNATPQPDKIVNITIIENCTREAMGTGSSLVIETFLVDKLESDTSFLVQGTISCIGSGTYAMTQGWQYGDGDEVVGQGVFYTDTNYCRIYSTQAIIRNHTTTGLQLMSFRFFSINGTSASQPFSVYNPNATDDARLAQTCSTYVIWELRE